MNLFKTTWKNKTYIKTITKSKFIAIFTTALFLILLPLSLKIVFFQNDDWYYYEQVRLFQDLNFILESKIAPTFYLQGLMGAVFASVFTINRLPVLTLMFSVLNFYMFAKILNVHFKTSQVISVLISLFFFLNPLHSYSIWGFMTENYFLFFVLLGLHFFFKNESVGGFRYLHISNLLVLLSFFIRQVGLFYYIATSGYYFLRGLYKKALLQLVWFVSLFLFYSNLFPKTSEMIGKSLDFNNLLDAKYFFTIAYGSLIYVVSFTLPLVLLIIFYYIIENRTNLSKILIFILLSLALYFIYQNLFAPELVSWGEYPYFENTYERSGFLPRDISGTKYQFRGNFDLYLYLELFSKIAAALFSSYIILNYKKTLERRLLIVTLLIVSYLLTITLSETFFDRYLVTMVPLFILFLSAVIEKLPHTSKVSLSILCPWVVFLGILFYTFSLDFILVEAYVWKKSEELVRLGVTPNSIYSTTAWNEKYPANDSLKPFYLFTYDSHKVNNLLKDEWLYDVYYVNYPLNIHISPRVYLYKVE